MLKKVLDSVLPSLPVCKNKRKNAPQRVMTIIRRREGTLISDYSVSIVAYTEKMLV
jgi:hypothetical protein